MTDWAQNKSLETSESQVVFVAFVYSYAACLTSEQ